MPCAAEVLTVDGNREVLALDGGFISVADNRVSLLSQFAKVAKEIDLKAAEHELAAAEKRLNAGELDEETRQHFLRAQAQVKAAHLAQQKLRPRGARMDWLGITELVALTLVVLLLIPVLFLGVRRRWLSRQGGLFDCSVRLSTRRRAPAGCSALRVTPGTTLEWFRRLRLSLRPRLIFPRSQSHARCAAGGRPDRVRPAL